MKMKISRQKLNQWLKICHMNYSKGTKLHANIITDVTGQKYSTTYFNKPEDNMQN